MAAMQDIKSRFSSLEERVHKLIHLHEEAKAINAKLIAEKRQMILELNEEKEKSRRMEEGYKNLKEIEKNSSYNSISNMKRKINDIILEIDRNMSLIQEK
jgi:hypothetical protein